MLPLLLILSVVALLLTGVIVGLIARGWLLTPRDRQHLEVVAEGLLAEARVDALTHSTLLAMRHAVRDVNRDADSR